MDGYENGEKYEYLAELPAMINLFYKLCASKSTLANKVSFQNKYSIWNGLV